MSDEFCNYSDAPLDERIARVKECVDDTRALMLFYITPGGKPAVMVDGKGLAGRSPDRITLTERMGLMAFAQEYCKNQIHDVIAGASNE